MAVIPRVAPIGAPAPVIRAQLPAAGLRNIASVEGVPVEPSGAAAYTAFESATLLTQAYGRRASDRPQQRPIAERDERPFVPPNPVLGALIQAVQTADVGGGSGAAARNAAGLAPRVVGTYESALAAVSGATPRGQAVSLSL